MYFLEGPPALLDQPGEWSYSTTEQKLRVRTPSGASPAQHRLTHKVQTYALNITESPHLTLANLSFLGAKNAYLLRHFILGTIVLPRQARDKHTENSKREGFSAGTTINAAGVRMIMRAILYMTATPHRMAENPH